MSRVLVVEDDPDISTLLADVLEDAGIACVVAGSKAEAQKRLDAENFDMLITDLLLPDGPADELATAASGKGMRVLVMSGNPHQIAHLESALVHTMAKPFKMAAFIDRVQSILAS